MAILILPNEKEQRDGILEGAVEAWKEARCQAVSALWFYRCEDGDAETLNNLVPKLVSGPEGDPGLLIEFLISFAIKLL